VPRDDLPDVPDPELLDLRADGARAALERLVEDTHREAFDWLFDRALERPIHPESYPDSRRLFFGPTGAPAKAPEHGVPTTDVFRAFRERVAPMTFNAEHPAAFSYFTPPPLAMSVAGETLAQWLQQGVDVWHAGPVGAFVEEEVTRWLADLIGMPAEGWGVLTSGGVMANLMALAVAREVHLRRLLSLEHPPRAGDLEGARVYASDQTHFSVARGLDVLGFRPHALHIVASDDRFRLRPEPVAAAIEADRAAGHTPFAISAVAGSTNTGSVDDVVGLASLARREELWLHVDAAYGGAARLSARDAPRVPGLELADSVTVDPHKWFFQAYDIGGLLVRDGAQLGQVFGGRAPEYYRGGEGSGRPTDEHDEPDPHGDQLNFYKLSFEGTRRWRALKLWMSWKHLGTEGFGRLIEATDDLAALLARRCAESDDFEAIPATPQLSVVCFRHLPGGREAALAMPPPAVDAHQDRLQAALEASGDGWLTTTRLRGSTWLRAGIVNYLSTEADIEGLLATLRRLAADEVV
jgi:glutamate/tyrosine decarboxylase-like PLP-dependent enzyme